MNGYDNRKLLQLRETGSTALEHPEQCLEAGRQDDILLEQLLGRNEVLLGGGEEHMLDRALLRVELIL